MTRTPIFASRSLAGTAFCVLLASCGGSGGGGNNGPAPLSISTASLDDGIVGVSYLQVIATTGGTGAKTFSVEGDLPAGLTLGTDGTLSGTPEGPSVLAEITVSVSDSGSPEQTDSQEFSFNIAEPLAVDVGTPPMATIGVAYSHQVAVSGGVPPYQFTIELPPGLTFDEDGTISGTPEASATTAVGTLIVTDGASPAQNLGADLRLPVTLEVATASMPDANGGVEYDELVVARGGLPDYDWNQTGGTLPPGLALEPDGRVSGMPDASCTASSTSFDVEVQDSDSPAQTASRQGITLDVNPSVLGFAATGALSVGEVGDAYSEVVQISAGVPPFVFAVTSGALPAGLTLSAATGQILGTPTTDVISNFTVEVNDDCGVPAEREFTIIVRPEPTGRNETIATATPLGNGTFIASISPSGSNDATFDPDEDYYEIRTFAASTVTVDLTALGGELDTVMEIVNSSDNRLGSCGAPSFDDECVNDDESPGTSLDSILQVRVDGPTTFYIHVVEWRGDARPDLQYNIEISGVN